MRSAQGAVQQFGYEATFPLLLNVSGQPTYFMALKDASQLVKQYAMVNVQKYQVVGIGDTVSECEEEYHKLLLKEGLQIEEDTRESGSITGKITKIAQGVVDGDSHYFMMIEGSDDIFDISVVEFIDIIKYEVGQEISLEYKIGEKTNVVTSVK